MYLKEWCALICGTLMLVQQRMAGLLRGGGYANVHRAHDGFAAVEMYKRLKPGTVFMDIAMLGKTGAHEFMQKPL